MKLIIERKDFISYPFSDSYIKWIKETHSVVTSITDESIIIEGKLSDVFKAVLFIGYAWGEQSNGR